MKNWGFQTVVLEKTLERLLNSKETKLVNPKGNQPWIFIGRIDPEAEALILWPPDPKSQFVGKDPDAGKDWGWKKEATEEEVVRCHHRLNRHEFEQNSRRYLMTLKPGLLHSMRSQNVGHDWVTENQQQCPNMFLFSLILQLDGKWSCGEFCQEFSTYIILLRVLWYWV